MFPQYANEALRWAVQSKNENATQVLVELARALWTHAAENSPPGTRHLPQQLDEAIRRFNDRQMFEGS